MCGPGLEKRRFAARGGAFIWAAPCAPLTVSRVGFAQRAAVKVAVIGRGWGVSMVLGVDRPHYHHDNNQPRSGEDRPALGRN